MKWQLAQRLNVTKHSAGISSQMKRQLAQRLNVTKHSAAISSQNCISTKPTTALHPQFCSSEMGLVWLWSKAVRIQNINKIKYAAVLAFCTALIATNKASHRKSSMAMITQPAKQKKNVET